MSQSSIEWLSHELSSLSFDYLVGQISNKEHNERYDKILNQAKEMHKQEIIEAWDNAAIDATYGNKFSSAEQYYNKTFNK